MKRREFITLLGGGAAAWPLSARAQRSERMRRVGVLMNAAATESSPQSWLAAFVQGLHELGWSEGRNIRIDVRWNAGDAALARIYAAQLVGLMPDVIVAASTTNLIVVREATNTVPIVFIAVSDPVAQGFVASVSEPGGNITGFSGYEFSIGGKWLQLLKEVAPSIIRVAVLFNPDTSPQSKFFQRSIQAAAPSLNLLPIAAAVRNTAEIGPAIEMFANQPNGSLVLPTDAFLLARYQLVADVANRYRLPSIGPDGRFVKNGGLMFYGQYVAFLDQYRQMAGYVDRILRGEKPANLPVQGSTKYEMGFNLKTAKALGLTVPPTLLAIADEVIE